MKRIIIYSSCFTILTLCGMGIFAQQYSVCESGANYVEMQQTCNNVPGEYEAREKISLMPNFRFNINDGGNQVFSIKLNETIVLDLESTPEINVPDIEDIETNTSLSVGSIAGMHGVSGTGAATYTVPIGVPGGVAGLEPNISINYNSQSGNGLLGWGWYLAGTSAIVRVPQTEYYDGNITAIQLNNDDRFMLDGLRLLPKNSENYVGYGTNNYEYEKEITDFSTIKSISNTEGPQSFIVTTKDGIVIEYGVTADSRLLTSGGKILAWNINKITDRNGNYITFTYDNSDEECVISYIEYTGNTNAGQEPTNKVTFVYDKRGVDKNQMYISNGQFIKSEKILTKIIVRSNNSVLSKYEFNYFSDNIYNKLYEIKQYGINDEEINSTIVNWGEKEDFQNIEQTISYTGEEQKFSFGNYLQNGKTDIIYSGIEYISSPPSARRKYNFYYTNNTKSLQFLSSFNQEEFTHHYEQGNTNSPFNVTFAYSTFSQVKFSANFRGYMQDELLTIQSEPVENYPSYLSYKNYALTRINENESNSIQTNYYTFPNDRVVKVNERDLILGDFNGDGNTDILALFYDKSSINLSAIDFVPLIISHDENNRYTFDCYVNPTEQFRLTSSYFDIYPIDFTGDGKDELMIMGTDALYIYAVDVESNSNTFSLIYTNASFTNNKIYGFGDFNGDGKLDFLFERYGQVPGLAYNTGNGFTIDSFLDNYYYMDSYVWDKPYEPNLVLGDFSGDGKADVAVLAIETELFDETLLSTPHPGELYLCKYNIILKIDIYTKSGLSDFSFNKTNNYSFILDQASITNPNSCPINLQSDQCPECSTLIKSFIAADFTGNGKTDFFSTETFDLISLSDETDNLLVTNILDGMGNEVKYEYKAIPNTENYVNQSSINDEDYLKLLVPTTVVTKIKQDNAYYDGTSEEEFTTTEYFYEGSLFYKPKRSWVGFNKTSSLVNETILSESMSEPEYDGLLMPTYSKTEITNELISDAEFGYEVLNPNSSNSKIIFPYQNNIVEKQYTGPSFITSTTINNFNNDGNLYFSKTTNDNNIDDNKIITETDYVYVGAGEITTPHKLEKVTSTTTYQNFDQASPEDDFETEMFYEYYPNGNLKKQTDNKALILTHYEDYNHYGLPQAITTNVPDKTARTKNFVYSQCGRFVLKETDDMDFSVEYAYHPSTNNLISTTDAFGHTTTYKYDNLNRLIEVTDPFGIKTKKTYEWALNSGIDNAVYKVTTSALNSPDQTAYFDKLTRNIRSETKGYQNRTIAVDSHYDKWGNLYKKSEPYFDNENPLYIVNEYYESGYKFNKIHTQTSRGLQTSYDYLFNSGWTTYPSGNTYFSKYDIAGNIIRSTYPGGNEVNFTYYSHLQPKSIMANGVETLTGYNEFAYQTELADANAGTIEYDYFADGMLKTQTDARGMEIEMQYDQFDRIKKLILDSGDGEVEYEYYTDGNAKAMIKSVTAPVNETEYEYDSFQRIVKLSETIDNTEYEFDYIYDSKGNLIKEIYPNGFGIQYEYDNNGLLTGVKELTTNQNIWNTTDYNALGQVGNIYLRNNHRIKYTYDSQTGLLSNIAFGDQNQSFGIAYYFNAATGNLEARSCQNHNITENFTYDNLNRLRTYTVEQNSNIEEFEVQYYDNGNISEKSDVGQYIYDDTYQPHAVKAILPYEMEGGQYQHNPLLDQDIQYNSFNKATKITQGEYELEIFYGHDEERRKSVLKQGETTVYTRYYLGKYEKQINHTTNTITEYYYVGGPMGNTAVYISENGETPELYYTITDHLGSIVAITDEQGEIIEEQGYDPWGQYRNSVTGEPEETPQLTMLFRGYTGHEMLPEFGLINMNGRLYDPVIARVLSPDNYVQNPNNPQNYNRYSYCYNNPLVYVDPSGEWVHLVVGGIIGGTMNLIMNANNIDSFWQGLGYFGVGAVTGALSAGVGVGIQTASAGASFWAGFVGSSQGISTILSVGYSSSFLTGAATGFGSGFVGGLGSGFGNNLIGGNTFRYSFMTGVQQGLYSGAIGGLTGGIVGGIDAYRNGRDFFNGGPTLETKLEILLEKNNFLLNYEIGEAGVCDVYLANRKNLSSLEGYSNLFGDILQPDGTSANGLCEIGRGFDITYDGYVRFTDNEIYLSKNTVRRMWRGSISARETLFHEWFHARDYYTGTADFFFQQYGHDWTKTSNMLEFRAHSFNYSRLQNINRLNLMEHYSRLFFGFPGLY